MVKGTHLIRNVICSAEKILEYHIRHM